MSLELLSILYLGVPVVMFLLGWLYLPVGLAFTALLLVCFYVFVKDRKVEVVKIDGKFFGLLFLLAFVWVFFSGMGGFTFQTGDWEKHFAILYDLIQQSWPVAHLDAESPTGLAHLVYYFGFYLVPAAVGKLAGWEVMTAFLMPYAALGVSLGFYWLRVLTGHKLLAVFVLFIWTSGLDIIGWLIKLGGWPPFQEHMEWWAGIHMQYSATTNLLFWVPQQALAAWIGIPLILEALRKKNWAASTLGIVSLPLWSPFVCVGIAPFVLARLYQSREHYRDWLRPLVVVGFFALLYYLFYSSVVSNVGLRFSLFRLDNVEKILSFLLFHLLEYLVFFAAIFWCWSQSEWRKNRMIFVLALVLLMLIPTWESRMWNDWAMRTSIPALYLMWVMFLKTLFEQKKNSLKYIVMGSLIIMGSVTPFKEFERSVDWFSMERRELYDVRPSYVEFFDPRYKKQYFSDGTGFFHQYLASK